MKKQDCDYELVSPKDANSIVTSADPINASRLPIGVVLTAQPDLRLVPASGTITKPWQAVMLVDELTQDVYFVSPRVMLGLAFKGKKFGKVIEQPFPKVPLLDYLKNSPKVTISEYANVKVDDFETKELVDKAMPRFVIAQATAAPKPKKVENNA